MAAVLFGAGKDKRRSAKNQASEAIAPQAMAKK
jgi:hypothetical protein